MLDTLRNQERLSGSEEERIDRNARIVILVLTGIVVAVIIWAVASKKTIGTWYYALILTLLAVIWIVKCVVAGILKHALAQRTDEQVNAYLKAAGLELAAYAGLAWFLIGMNGNGIFGAIIYLFGITGARKQREIYYQEPGQEEEQDSARPSSEDSVMESQTREIPESGDGNMMDTLPSAADREQREQTAKQTEEDYQADLEAADAKQRDREDGSV